MTDTLLRRVEGRGLVTELEVVGWVIGERPKGSWWAHPRAKEAYDALLRLGEETALLSVKLVDGKQTLVHRRLWPALARVQREESLWPALSLAAGALLGEVRKSGELQAKGKPRLELERALRVVAKSVHTEQGHHEAVLVPFEAWLPDAVAQDAKALSMEEALEQLKAAGWAGPARRAARRTRGPASLG